MSNLICLFAKLQYVPQKQHPRADCVFRKQPALSENTIATESDNSIGFQGQQAFKVKAVGSNDRQVRCSAAPRDSILLKMYITDPHLATP